jgi:hypothetical protein
MRQCLQNAIDFGQLSNTTDTKLIATYLVNEFRTLLMLAASGSTRNEIRRHLEVAIRVLD